MADDPPLVRQWKLLRLLSARHYGITIKDMIEELGASDKTLRRDLETFIQAGFPLEETVGERGRKLWRINPDKSQPGLNFAYDEALALYLGRSFLEPLAGTIFWEAAQRAFKKVRASLGKQAIKYLEQFASLFQQTTAGKHDYAKKAEILDALLVGIEDRRAVFLTYQSLRATEPVTYDIYPYGLVYHRGALYLVGRAPQHDEVRHWKVDRIEDAQLTEFVFPKPDGFDLHRHLSKSFGVYRGDGDVHVKIRFAPPVARYVEESRWHPSQRLTRHKDGTLTAEFDLSSTEEVKTWILSFVQHAVVEEPKGLRKAMTEEIRALAARYELKTKRSVPPTAP
jgi:proteasome accessory factor B